MPQVQSLADHTCPACGATAEWDPSRGALVCPYCGTESATEIDPDSGKVRELPLAHALRELPEEARGWNTERISVRCARCRAVSVFDPQDVGGRCAFCGSPELVDYEEIRSPIRPLSLLPFRVDRKDVRDAVRRWWKRRWLAPGSLMRHARVDEVRGIYLPYWTFDARVQARWTADSGTYHETTRTVRSRDGRQRTRRVRHVRWRSAAGTLSHFFDDELVPASRGVHPRLLRGVEPFPTPELVPYDTAYLSGFLVEHYQVVLLEAATRARNSMERRLRSMCAAQVPGDTHRNLRVDASWEDETFKHILLPVWIATYDCGRRSFQLAVNGSTARVAGEYPKSPWKIAGVLLTVIVVAALIVMLARG